MLVKKKLFVVFAMVALVAAGASAQLMFGVSGALHMDTQLDSNQIIDQFQQGEGIFYGPFAEIAFGRLGFGVSGNFSFWTDDVLQTEFVDYDVAFFVAYHLFKARFLLDPFVEIGTGYIAQDFANEAEDPNPDDPLGANMYWYTAFGVGVNLGAVGVFGKFAYNNVLQDQLDASNLVAYPDGKLPYYRLDMDGKPYIPAFRFTAGVKFIL
jgi:hypothetical protein